MSIFVCRQKSRYSFGNTAKIHVADLKLVHILDLISMMIDPINGLGDPEERLLGKGIEAKILIEEVEQTSLSNKIRNPLGLRMFNYKLIDLDNSTVFEENASDGIDIDGIREIVGFKALKQSKALPLTATQEFYEKEKIAKKIYEPSPLAKEKLAKSPQNTDWGRPPKLAIPSFTDLDDDLVGQEKLSQLLAELETKPEDEPKIKRFIDFYFNELIYKELVETEKNQNKNKTKMYEVLEQDKKTDYLHNYMKFLKEHTKINYQTYGCQLNQLDGNIEGTRNMDLYPCKLKTTNHIEYVPIIQRQENPRYAGRQLPHSRSYS